MFTSAGGAEHLVGTGECRSPKRRASPRSGPSGSGGTLCSRTPP